MRLRALVTAAQSIERFLRHIGEPTEPPTLSPARGPPFSSLASSVASSVRPTTTMRRASRRCSASDRGSQTATRAGDVCAPFAQPAQSAFAAREAARFRRPGVTQQTIVVAVRLSKFRRERNRAESGPFYHPIRGPIVLATRSKWWTGAAN
jgi:hypothetical protein